MSVIVDYVCGPAHWTSALVNGDFSGLEEDEAKACMEWADHLAKDGAYVVDVDGEPFFSHWYSEYGGLAPAGDLINYVTHENQHEVE